MADETLYLVDVFNLMFQVFHGIPPMTGPKGQPTNAVFGFTRDLMNLIAKQPSHLVCAMDLSGPGVRNDIYDQYKANRSEMPEDLRPQIPLTRTATEAFNIACKEKEGYEADDIIATLAVQARAAGGRCTIISSDKDLMQLVGDGVEMLDAMKNKRIDREGVFEKFGVYPERVVDVQALAGDSVDNVPGAPGIGIKTAALLINEYGDLDTLLERAEEVLWRE